MPSSPVSFGDAFPACIQNFKTAFSNLKPQIKSCFWLAAPSTAVYVAIAFAASVFLAGAAPSGSGGSADSGVSVIAALGFWASAFLFLLSIPLGVYTMFCTWRFVARVTTNPLQQFTLKQLYSYESSLWGFTGLSFIVAVVGLIPVALSCYLLMPLFIGVLACSLFSFLDSPSSGVSMAFSRGWTLTTKDWKRWLAMSLPLVAAWILSGFLDVIVMLVLSALPIVGILFMLGLQILQVVLFCYILCVLCCTYRDSVASIG